MLLFSWKEISFPNTGDGRNRKLNFTLGVRESTHYTAVYMIKAVEAENCQSEEKSCKQKLAYYLLLPILTASIPPWIEWIQKIRESFVQKVLLSCIEIIFGHSLTPLKYMLFRQWTIWKLIWKLQKIKYYFDFFTSSIKLTMGSISSNHFWDFCEVTWKVHCELSLFLCVLFWLYFWTNVRRPSSSMIPA